jgi:hypothetical protein
VSDHWVVGLCWVSWWFMKGRTCDIDSTTAKV